METLQKEIHQVGDGHFHQYEEEEATMKAMMGGDNNIMLLFGFYKNAFL